MTASLATQPFFAAEIAIRLPGGAMVTFTPGWGTKPWGAPGLVGSPLEATSVIYASDTGYRTRASDPGGVVSYPPRLTQAFQIDREVTLDITAAGASAAWGSLDLSNVDGAFDQIAEEWNSDRRAVRILVGNKAIENFAGPGTRRSTTGTYIDAAGKMQTAAPGVVRWDYSTGHPVALNEAASANGVSNPRFEGAVAGIPGTAPTAVSVLATAGMSTQIVGFGVTGSGIPYIDIRFFATAAAVGTFGLYLNQIPALPGQTWTFSAYWGQVAGSTSNVTNPRLGANASDAGYAQLAVISANSIPAPTTADVAKQRVWATNATATPASTVFVQPRFFATVAAAGAVDITYRFAGPQMELGSAPSTLILPPAGHPAASARGADNLYYARGIAVDPAYASLAPLLTCMATPWLLADTTLQVPLRDATYWLDGPLQTTLYAGTGGYEGAASLAGQPKPKARGGTAAHPICNVTPVLIDAAALIYQYTDGPGTVVNLYEGAALTIVSAGDTTNLYAGSTAAGHYRTDNSRGLFQLGSPPASGYAITCDVTGAFPLAGAQTTLMAIARYLMTEDLGLPVANIDLAAVAAADAAYPYTAGVWFAPQAVTASVALAQLYSSIGAKLVPQRDGTLGTFVLRALTGSETPAASLDITNIVSLTPQPLPASLTPPPYRIRVGYQHNNAVQTTGINTATATSTQQQFVAAADRYGVWISTTIQAAYGRPNDPDPLVGALLVQADAQAVANALGALWGAAPRTYDVEVPLAVGVGLDIGDVVSVTYPSAGLRAGRLGQVVGDSFTSTAATITVRVLI
ncbi:MAG: hypothetical protein P4L71_17225 [Acetobacteraceae bacterium]|nr:hypothetical protein [Acetobacteraceae bacterium]